MVEVVILTVIPEIAQYEFDTLLPPVSPGKKERIRKFNFFQDARNCLLGGVLARIEICRTTGLSNKQLEFLINVYDKPFMDDSPHIQFNISRAGHYIACAMVDESVGIDIELIKPANLKIAERFFSMNETEYILAGNQAFRFYEIWTKKESRITIKRTISKYLC